MNVSNDSTKIIDILIEFNANVNCISMFSLVPLLMAVENGFLSFLFFVFVLFLRNHFFQGVSVLFLFLFIFGLYFFLFYFFVRLHECRKNPH